VPSSRFGQNYSSQKSKVGNTVTFDSEFDNVKAKTFDKYDAR